MQPIVDFVAADAQGVITKETWRATQLACPRCKNAHTNVWALVSERPMVIMGTETRIFMCISCQFTGVGLNGFRADFDVARRAQQIIEQAYTEATVEE